MAATNDKTTFRPEMMMDELVKKEYLKSCWKTDDPIIYVAEGNVEWIRPSSIRSSDGAITSDMKQPWYITSEKQEKRNYDPIDTNKYVSSFVLVPNTSLTLGNLSPFFQSEKKTPLRALLGDQAKLVVPSSLQSMPSCRHNFSIRTMKDSISFTKVSLEHCDSITFDETQGVSCVLLTENVRSDLSTDSSIKINYMLEGFHEYASLIAHTPYTARDRLDFAFETLVACSIFKELGLMTPHDAFTTVIGIVRSCIMNTDKSKDAIEMIAEDVIYDDRRQLIEAWPSTTPMPKILKKYEEDKLPSAEDNPDQSKEDFLEQILLDIFGLNKHGHHANNSAF